MATRHHLVQQVSDCELLCFVPNARALHYYLLSYNLRSSNGKLLVPHARKTRLKTLGDRSLGVTASFLWNTLPAALRNTSNLETLSPYLRHTL